MVTAGRDTDAHPLVQLAWTFAARTGSRDLIHRSSGNSSEQRHSARTSSLTNCNRTTLGRVDASSK